MTREHGRPELALAAIVGGAAFGIVAWLVLVPWDLSEVDAEGRSLGNGGDDYASSIGLVAAMVLLLAVVLMLRRSARPWACWFAAGGLGAWTGLFAWRAGSAATTGANLFMVPLVTVVVPAAIAAPIVIRAMSAHYDRREDERA